MESNLKFSDDDRPTAFGLLSCIFLLPLYEVRDIKIHGPLSSLARLGVAINSLQQQSQREII